MPGKGPVGGCPHRGIGCLGCRRQQSCPEQLADDYLNCEPARKAAPRRKGNPAMLALLQSEVADVQYLYDGSLPGFFSCVHHSVYQRQLPAAIQPEAEAQPTLYRQLYIDTNAEKARRVKQSIPQKISPRAMELVEKAFLSCMPGKELAVLRFLLLGYGRGSEAPWLFGHPDTAPLLQAEKHLMGEQHLLRGFVRFADHGGVLTAAITPKNFVLPFLAGHFVGRYPDEDFLIYDKTHKAALVYQQKKARIVPAENIQFPEPDADERQFRALWKRFYDTIAIEGRHNERCRRTHMPKRYWENMVEMQDQY